MRKLVLTLGTALVCSFLSVGTTTAQQLATVGQSGASALSALAFSKILGTSVEDANHKRFGMIADIIRDSDGRPTHYRVSLGYQRHVDYAVDALVIIPGIQGHPDLFRLK